MKVAFLIAQRSTCLRRKVGAVLVKNKQILATGYNGAPTKVEHCETTGCLRQKLGVDSGKRHEICRGLHAEQNVVLQAARHGITVEGSTLYITSTPCSICAKMIINAGIRKIVAYDLYPDKMAGDFLQAAGVGVLKLEDFEF